VPSRGSVPGSAVGPGRGSRERCRGSVGASAHSAATRGSPPGSACIPRWRSPWGSRDRGRGSVGASARRGARGSPRGSERIPSRGSVPGSARGPSRGSRERSRGSVGASARSATRGSPRGSAYIPSRGSLRGSCDRGPGSVSGSGGRTVRGSAAGPLVSAGPVSVLRWRGFVPRWPEDVRRPAGSCGPPSLMFPLFVRQRETPWSGRARSLHHGASAGDAATWSAMVAASALVVARLCPDQSATCPSACVRGPARCAGRSSRTERKSMPQRPGQSQRPGQRRDSQRKLAEIRRQQRARQARLRVLAGGAALAAHMWAAAEHHPGWPRHRERDGVPQRQAVLRRPALDQTHPARAHPAQRRQGNSPEPFTFPAGL
jgi:hypothetical protein